MKLAAVLAAVAVAVAGCATTASAPHQMVNTFDPKDMAWAMAPGTNTIEGSALMRTRGGDIKTCGGIQVVAVPVTPFTAERMSVLYGSSVGGSQAVYASAPRMEPAVDLNPWVRKTVCDAQGAFSFTKLPDGEFFVVAEVFWMVDLGNRYPYTSMQGGRMMQRVKVSGGATTKIILAQ